MSTVRLPPGYRIEPLRRNYPRSAFRSGQAQVDDWLANKALALTTNRWRFTGVGISTRCRATTTDSF